MTYPLICFTCGATGSVGQITAGLQCRCGSKEIELFDGSAEQLTIMAKGGQPWVPTKTDLAAFANSGGTGWGKSMPDPLKGWDDYAGPMPGKNPWSNNETASDRPCPVCHGSGQDIQDGGTCRECGGDGKMTPTTSVQPAPQVARHNYPSTQTDVPFMAKKKMATSTLSPEDVIKSTTTDYAGGFHPEEQGLPFNWENQKTHFPKKPSVSPNLHNWTPVEQKPSTNEPFAMQGASCPNCGQDPTHLVPDYKGEQWWHCKNCGPLANVDRKLNVNPYSPPDNFTPNSGQYRASKKFFAGKETGRLRPIMATIAETNPGLRNREVFLLAWQTLQQYSD